MIEVQSPSSDRFPDEKFSADLREFSVVCDIGKNGFPYHQKTRCMMIENAQAANVEPVKELLEGVRDKNDLAEKEFFEFYAPRIERVCARVLGSLPSRPGAIVSAESKAISTMRSVMISIQKGRFGELSDESGLLRLLITIATRKCRDAQRAHFAKSRGSGRLVRPSDFTDEDGSDTALDSMGQILETPFFEVEMQERCERLMSILPEKDQIIAQKRLEGYTEEEIADLIGMSRRSVQLHIKSIREKWSRMLEE